jgi:ribonuclease D
MSSIISKDEVNKLPVVLFEGGITMVDNPSAIEDAMIALRRCHIVGVDTETKPSFTRGIHHKVSLLQIATLDHCFLFRLNMIDFPPELGNYLADKKVKKIGLSLRDDLLALNKRYAFKPDGFIDIQSIAQSYGVLELSLQKIYAILFSKKISKSQRLTNWENPELTEQQIRYAATDAWASLQIYNQLMTQKKLTKKEIETLLAEKAVLQRENKELNNPDNSVQV